MEKQEMVWSQQVQSFGGGTVDGTCYQTPIAIGNVLWADGRAIAYFRTERALRQWQRKIRGNKFYEPVGRAKKVPRPSGVRLRD